MDYSLSDGDIRRIVPGVKVISYPELRKYKHFEQALDAQGRVAILFLTESARCGHWICLHVRPGTKEFEFFDSYGESPDSEERWLTPKKLSELHEEHPEIVRLLTDARSRGYHITYSHKSLQGKTSETCGRHVSVRLLNNHLTLPEYYNQITGSGLTPDQYVVSVTQPIIGK